MSCDVGLIQQWHPYLVRYNSYPQQTPALSTMLTFFIALRYCLCVDKLIRIATALILISHVRIVNTHLFLTILAPLES